MILVSHNALRSQEYESQHCRIYVNVFMYAYVCMYVCMHACMRERERERESMSVSDLGRISGLDLIFESKS